MDKTTGSGLLSLSQLPTSFVSHEDDGLEERFREAVSLESEVRLLQMKKKYKRMFEQHCEKGVFNAERNAARTEAQFRVELTRKLNPADLRRQIEMRVDIMGESLEELCAQQRRIRDALEKELEERLASKKEKSETVSERVADIFDEYMRQKAAEQRRKSRKTIVQIARQRFLGHKENGSRTTIDGSVSAIEPPPTEKNGKTPPLSRSATPKGSRLRVVSARRPFSSHSRSRSNDGKTSRKNSRGSSTMTSNPADFRVPHVDPSYLFGQDWRAKAALSRREKELQNLEDIVVMLCADFERRISSQSELSIGLGRVVPSWAGRSSLFSALERNLHVRDARCRLVWIKGVQLLLTFDLRLPKVFSILDGDHVFYLCQYVLAIQLRVQDSIDTLQAYERFGEEDEFYDARVAATRARPDSADFLSTYESSMDIQLKQRPDSAPGRAESVSVQFSIKDKHSFVTGNAATVAPSSAELGSERLAGLAGTPKGSRGGLRGEDGQSSEDESSEDGIELADLRMEDLVKKGVTTKIRNAANSESMLLSIISNYLQMMSPDVRSLFEETLQMLVERLIESPTRYEYGPNDGVGAFLAKRFAALLANVPNDAVMDTSVATKAKSISALVEGLVVNIGIVRPGNLRGGESSSAVRSRRKALSKRLSSKVRPSFVPIKRMDEAQFAWKGELCMHMCKHILNDVYARLLPTNDVSEVRDYYSEVALGQFDVQFSKLLEDDLIPRQEEDNVDYSDLREFVKTQGKHGLVDGAELFGLNIPQPEEKEDIHDRLHRNAPQHEDSDSGRGEYPTFSMGRGGQDAGSFRAQPVGSARDHNRATSTRQGGPSTSRTTKASSHRARGTTASAGGGGETARKPTARILASVAMTAARARRKNQLLGQGNTDGVEGLPPVIQQPNTHDVARARHIERHALLGSSFDELVDRLWKALDKLKYPMELQRPVADRYSREYRIQMGPDSSLRHHQKAISVFESQVLLWESIAEAVVNREMYMQELEDFEYEASDPMRLFGGSSLDRLLEEKSRRALMTHIKRSSQHCALLIEKMRSESQHEVLYAGISYKATMSHDVSDLLYRLETRRMRFKSGHVSPRQVRSPDVNISAAELGRGGLSALAPISPHAPTSTGISVASVDSLSVLTAPRSPLDPAASAIPSLPQSLSQSPVSGPSSESRSPTFPTLAQQFGRNDRRAHVKPPRVSAHGLARRPPPPRVLTLRIRSLWQISTNVMEVVLEIPEGLSTFHFFPGQWMYLYTPTPKAPTATRHSFYITSSPLEVDVDGSQALSLCIRNQVSEDEVVSDDEDEQDTLGRKQTPKRKLAPLQDFIRDLSVGRNVTVEGPFGDNHLDPTFMEQVVFCAYGNGLLPALSMVRYASMCPRDCKLSILLIYFCTSTEFVVDSVDSSMVVLSLDHPSVVQRQNTIPYFNELCALHDAHGKTRVRVQFVPFHYGQQYWALQHYRDAEEIAEGNFPKHRREDQLNELTEQKLHDVLDHHKSPFAVEEKPEPEIVQPALSSTTTHGSIKRWSDYLDERSRSMNCALTAESLDYLGFAWNADLYATSTTVLPPIGINQAPQTPRPQSSAKDRGSGKRVTLLRGDSQASVEADAGGSKGDTSIRDKVDEELRAVEIKKLEKNRQRVETWYTSVFDRAFRMHDISHSPRGSNHSAAASIPRMMNVLRRSNSMNRTKTTFARPFHVNPREAVYFISGPGYFSSIVEHVLSVSQKVQSQNMKTLL